MSRRTRIRPWLHTTRCTVLAGLLAAMSGCGQSPSTFEPDAGPPALEIARTVYIGQLAPGKSLRDCALPPSWSAKQLFPEDRLQGLNNADALLAYVQFTHESRADDSARTALMDAAGRCGVGTLTEDEPNLVVSSGDPPDLGGVPSDTDPALEKVQQSMRAQMREQFKAAVRNWKGEFPDGGVGGEVVLFDTAPTAPPEVAPGGHLDDHGHNIYYTLRDSMPGNIRIRTYQVMPYVTPAIKDPDGGNFGRQGELADSLVQALVDVAPRKGGPIVFVLSLGVDPVMADPGTHSESAAVRDAIRTATCNGVLVVTAAGNLFRGAQSSRGPTFPGALETDDFPMRSCQTKRRSTTSVFATDFDDNPLLISRPGSAGPLAALGINSTAGPVANHLPPPRSGSSLAAAVVGAVSAVTWSYGGDKIDADQALDLVQRTSQTLRSPIFDARYLSPSAPDGPRRVSMCEAINAATQGRAQLACYVPAQYASNPPIDDQTIIGLDGAAAPGGVAEHTSGAPFQDPDCSFNLGPRDATNPQPFMIRVPTGGVRVESGMTQVYVQLARGLAEEKVSDLTLTLDGTHHFLLASDVDVTLLRRFEVRGWTQTPHSALLSWRITTESEKRCGAEQIPMLGASVDERAAFNRGGPAPNQLPKPDVNQIGWASPTEGLGIFAPGGGGLKLTLGVADGQSIRPLVTTSPHLPASSQGQTFLIDPKVRIAP